MAFTFFSVAIILIFSVVAFIEIFRGRNRGFIKSMISLGTVIVSVIIALPLSPFVSSAIVAPVFGIVQKQSFYIDLMGENDALNLFVSLCASIVVSAVLFVLLVFIIRGIFALLIGRFYRVFLKKDGNRTYYGDENAAWYDRNTKFLGALAGVASAVIITMVLTAPIMGTLDVAKTVIDLAKRGDSDIFEEAGIPAEQIDRFDDYAHDIPGNIFYRLGGKYMFSTVASTKLNGDRIYLFDEVEQLGSAMDDFLTILPVVRGRIPAEEVHFQRIESLCEHVEEMEAGSLLVAGYLPRAANSWLNGRKFFGISKPQLNSNVAPIFDALLNKCREIDAESVKSDTVSLLRVYALMLKCDLPEDDTESYAEMLQVIEENGIIESLRAEFSRNPNMKDLYTETSMMAVGFVSKYTHERANKDSLAYEEFMTNIANSILIVKNRGYGTEEEMIDVLAIYVERYIREDSLGEFVISEAVAKYTAEQLLAAVDDGDTTAVRVKAKIKNIL